MAPVEGQQLSSQRPERGAVLMTRCLPVAFLIAFVPGLARSAAPTMDANTFLARLEGMTQEGCSRSRSPFFCYSSDSPNCRRALGTARDACIEQIRQSLPERIDAPGSRAYREQFVSCVMDTFITTLGPEHIRVDKCQSQN